MGELDAALGECLEHGKQVVRSVIEELNFRPDPAARSLAGGRAMSIGVLTQFIDSPYYGEALRGIEDVVQQEFRSISDQRKEGERLACWHAGMVHLFP